MQSCAICSRPISEGQRYCQFCASDAKRGAWLAPTVLVVGLAVVGAYSYWDFLQPPDQVEVAEQPPKADAKGNAEPAKTEAASAPPAPPGEPSPPPESKRRTIDDVAKHVKQAMEGEPLEETAAEKAERIAKEVDEIDIALQGRSTRVRALQRLAKLGTEGRSLVPLVVKVTDWSSFEEETTIALDKVDPRWRESPAAKEAIALALPYYENTFSEWRNGGPAIHRIKLIGPMAKPLFPRLVEVLFKDDPEIHRMTLDALESVYPGWREDPETLTVAKDNLKTLTYQDPNSGVGLSRGTSTVYNLAGFDTLGEIGPPARIFLPEMRRLLKQMQQFGSAFHMSIEVAEVINTAISKIESDSPAKDK